MWYKQILLFYTTLYLRRVVMGGARHMWAASRPSWVGDVGVVWGVFRLWAVVILRGCWVVRRGGAIVYMVGPGSWATQLVSLKSSGMYPHRTGKIGWYISQCSVLGLDRNPQESSGILQEYVGDNKALPFPYLPIRKRVTANCCSTGVCPRFVSLLKTL